MNYNLISNIKSNKYIINWQKELTCIFWITFAAIFSFFSFRLIVAVIDSNFRLISNFISGIAMVLGNIFGQNDPNLESLLMFSIILILNLPFLAALFIVRFNKKIIFYTFYFLLFQWLLNFINLFFSHIFKFEEHGFFPFLIGDDRVRSILNAFIAGILIGIAKIFLYNGRATFGALDLLYIYFSIQKRKDISKYTFWVNFIIIFSGIITLQTINPQYYDNGSINYILTTIYGFIRLIGTFTYIYASKIISEHYNPKNKIICCDILLTDPSIIMHFLKTINVQRTFTYLPVTKQKFYERKTYYSCYLVLTDYESKLLRKYIKVNYKNSHIFISTYIAISVIGYFENINFQGK